MNHRFMSNRSGAILAMAAAAAFLLIGLTAIVTDIGYVYYNQARLQTAINASWKAGYDRMVKINQEKGHITDEDKTEIRNHILEIMKINGYTDEGLTNIGVTFGNNNNLHITDRKPVGLFFSRIFNQKTTNVTAERFNHQLDTGQGIVPLGIPHGVVKDISGTRYTADLFKAGENFIVDREYILKLGNSTDNLDNNQASDEGLLKHKFGLLDPDNYAGGNETDYLNRFKYGYSAPVDLGARVLADDGNKQEHTDEAVDFRVVGDNDFEANRRVIVPITDIGPEIAENNLINAAAQTIYDLQGLDNPGGDFLPGDEGYNFGASVRVIGFAEFEILNPDEYTRKGDEYGEGDLGDLGHHLPGQVRGKFIRYIIKPARR